MKEQEFIELLQSQQPPIDAHAKAKTLAQAMVAYDQTAEKLTQKKNTTFYT